MSPSFLTLCAGLGWGIVVGDALAFAYITGVPALPDPLIPAHWPWLGGFLVGVLLLAAGHTPDAPRRTSGPCERSRF
jgi:hypothetical protein